MHIFKRLVPSFLTALWLVQGALTAEAQQTPQSIDEQQRVQEAGAIKDQDLFPPEQIEQLVAPIALYPDALIAQILMAATYPLDIVQAARWLSNNKDLEGEALEQAADAQSWDPSVKALVFFPSVLEFMNNNLDWTQDLGDAMLAQQQDVMDAVQRLRAEAQQAGTLQTTEQQRVETEGDTIVIQPASSEVVYVPTYNPSTVYGQPAPPANIYYPATYTTPVATTSASNSWINFGTGALVGGLLTAAILWDRNDYRIYYGGPGYYGAPGYWGSPNYWGGGWKQPVNINRNVNIYRGNVNINREFKKWEHNPQHRGGVRYRNNSTRQRYASVRKERGIDRDVARGRDPARKRPGTGGGKRPGTKPAQRPETRNLKKPATREAARPSKPAPRAAGKTAQKGAVGSKQKRAAKPARKSGAKPAQRSTARNVKRPSKSGSRRSGAFNVGKGQGARAASRRGAKSRGGNRAAKRGGKGGGRGGGGGGHRGGGRHR